MRREILDSDASDVLFMYSMAGYIALVLTEANHKKDRRCNQGIIELQGKWKNDEIKGALVFEAELAK